MVGVVRSNDRQIDNVTLVANADFSRTWGGFAVVKGGDAGALSSLKVRGLVLLVREVEHSSSPLSQEVIAAVDRVCWS